MNNCMLIVKKKYCNAFESFFAENDITEGLAVFSKSSNENFLIDLIGIKDNSLYTYFLKLKQNQQNKIKTYIKENNMKNCIFFKLTKERDMETKTQSKDEYSKLVFCTIPEGFTELVIESVKNVGESGATIIGAKGYGKNYESFLGMSLQKEREIVLIATTEQKAKLLKQEIRKKMLKSQINGVIFTLAIEDFENIQ